MVDERELSQLVALAWDGEPGAGPGPRRGLSVARIVDTAIRLADDGDIAAASMPKLAQALGAGTMSLYRYVPSKVVLMLLMADRATEAVPQERRGIGWQDALALYSRHAYDRYARHPWLLDIPVVGFPQTPRVLAWLDFGLAALAGAGFRDQDQIGAMLLLDGHVTATARIRRSASQAEGASEPPLDRIEQGLLPQLASLARAGAFVDDDFDDFGYRFGLDRIIESIDRLERRQP